MNDSMRKSLDKAERIGVIGSPSSTSNLTIDILGTAIDKKLVGSLNVFNYIQDGYDHYALGQIMEINLQNIWTQSPTMRGLIRQRGRVDPITERQDTHTAKMEVSAVFAKIGHRIVQSIFGTVPSTGTPILLLNQEILDNLLHEHQEEIFYLGKAYGSEILMPMWFKHFGDPPLGAGEAYHIGVFGKTGSGKSVLAKMIMIAYARHKEMSIFILDPQGEFSKDFRSDSNIKNILYDKYSREVDLYSLHNLVLTGWPLFKKILVNSAFFRELGVSATENRRNAAKQVQNILSRSGRGTLVPIPKIVPWEAHTRVAFDRIWDGFQTDDVLQHVYASRDGRVRVRNIIENADQDHYYDLWRSIANLFKYADKKNAIKISDLVAKIHEEEGKIIIIDLSEHNVPVDILWNDMIKLVIIGEFIDRITNEAEKEFKEDKLLNGLVVIDEAHRLAPREKTDNEELERIKQSLVDAIRETRKFGLGWMFISQTLSSLHKEIINQTRIHFFGFGLAWGAERRALEDLIGGQREAMSLYQRFRDPQSSLGDKTYSFMTVGPISPLSFSGTPLFFNALKYPDEFINLNIGNKIIGP